jgi:TolA-binding protein
MTRSGGWLLSCATVILAAATPTGARGQQTGLSPTKLFGLADDARAAGRIADAEIIYRALTKDPDIEIRSEARFRLGMMLADQKRYRDAAIAFRELLDEKPGAVRVRLELARVLALMGNADAARRQLRQALWSINSPPHCARQSRSAAASNCRLRRTPTSTARPVPRHSTQ